MNIRPIPALIALAAVFLIGYGVWKTAHSPERQIRKQLKTMAEKASFSSDSGLLTQLGTAGELSKCFTDNVVFETPVMPYSVQSREDVQKAWLQLRRSLTSLNIDIAVHHIERNEGGQWMADITATARINGMDGEVVRRDFLVTWLREKRNWLASRVQQVSAIEP